MDRKQFQEARWLDDQIRKLRDVRREITDREVDFVDGDRRRSLGRMQLDPDKIDELREHLKVTALEWFDGLISEREAKMQDLGVECD